MTNQSPHQAEVYADDGINKFQGRWVGPGAGWEWPVHARFISWGIWFVVLPATLLADWLLTGEISPLPLIDIILSFVITGGLANLTNGEVTLSHALVYVYRIVRTASAQLRRWLSPPRPRLTRDTVKVSLRPGSGPNSVPQKALEVPAAAATAEPTWSSNTGALVALPVHRPILLPPPPPPPSPFAAPVGPVTTSPRSGVPTPPGVRPTGRASVPHLPHQPHRWDQR